MNSVQLLNTASELAFYSEKFAPGSAEALSKAGSFGLPFSLFGFAVVFGVLALIMVVIIIFGKVFGVAQAKPEKKTEAKPVVKKEEPKEEIVPTAAPAAVADDTNGIVAAIIAAISSYRNASGEIGGFRVVSFKKRK